MSVMSGGKIDLKKAVENEIAAFVEDQGGRCGMGGIWRRPLVGFADARSTEFPRLRETAHPRHVMPWEALEGAKTVIAYFVPFTESIGRGNAGAGLASADWARAYEETNAMLARLSRHLAEWLAKRGYAAASPAEALVFDRVNITCRWSQRHAAKIAGLGSFGLNNMLITERGCCGRLGSLITAMDVEHDKPWDKEACLYKRNGSCGVCAARCPAGALSPEGFDRVKCYAQCLKNAEVHRGYGNSYASAAGGEAEESGSEVCGKCLAGVPCAFRRP